MTDWTLPAEEVGKVSDSVIRKTIDAIYAADGEFITSPDGRGARIAAEREDEIEEALLKAGGSDGR